MYLINVKFEKFAANRYCFCKSLILITVACRWQRVKTSYKDFEEMSFSRKYFTDTILYDM